MIGILASLESLGRPSVGLLSGVWVGSFHDWCRHLGMVEMNQDLEGLESVSVHVMLRGVYQLSWILGVSSEQSPSSHSTVLLNDVLVSLA
jgi:hypothetical protein